MQKHAVLSSCAYCPAMSTKVFNLRSFLTSTSHTLNFLQEVDDVNACIILHAICFV
jgi:hypothetical protein